jgi:hypothetical protein
MEPCFSTVKEIYSNRNLDYALKGYNLFVWFHVSYTRYQKMNLYRLHTFPVPVPGNQGLVTRLRDVPKFLVGNAARSLMGELTKDPKQPMVKVEQIR